MQTKGYEEEGKRQFTVIEEYPKQRKRKIKKKFSVRRKLFRKTKDVY